MREPFGTVITLPAEARISGSVISLKPTLAIISLNSGYSVASSYTVFLKSMLFSMDMPPKWFVRPYRSTIAYLPQKTVITATKAEISSA